MFDFIKKAAIIISIVFVIYSGVQFGMPYYRYYAFKTDAVDIANFTYRGREPIEQLRDEMFEKAESVGLPISRNHIKVEKTETGYWVYIKWQEVVDILGQYQKTLHFEVEVSS